jgi:hypothetical protein
MVPFFRIKEVLNDTPFLYYLKSKYNNLDSAQFVQVNFDSNFDFD